MPLYEYKCYGCGETFEVIQKFSDAPFETHPKCGGKAERLLSPPALQFKGTGWYITDYARANGANKGEGKSGEQKSESGGKKASDSSGDGKSAGSASESKPAASSSKSDSK